MTFNVKNVILNDSKTPSTAAFKHVFLNYNDTNADQTKNVCFQIDNVKVPFGVQYQEFNNDIKASVAVSLGKNQSEILKHIHDIEDFVKNEAQKHTDTWFQKECVFKPSLYHKNKDYPPTLTLKIPTSAVIYDENKNIIKLSQVKKGTFVNMECCVSGLWISSTKYGLSWKVNELQTTKPKPMKKEHKKMETYAFDD